ncbi:MAG: L-threonylcarbamoyladenylate synthase [Thermodesulfobacteriota bacterium]
MLYINPDNPQQRLIDMAVTVLKRGGIVCYPTDTVYGMGCDMFNQKAVKRLYKLKGRAKHKPFSFICGADLKNVSTYCSMSNMAYRVMKKHLPGAYTFVLPAMKVVPKIMITKQKTVGIRAPDNEICRLLVAGLGNPLVTTSAGRAGEEPPASAYDLDQVFGSQVDEIIDGGDIFPRPSSVIDLTGGHPEIIRAGLGPVDDIV